MMSRYTENVDLNKLGVSVMNRDDISDDGYLARFHALERSNADWLNLFILPASDVWLVFLSSRLLCSLRALVTPMRFLVASVPSRGGEDVSCNCFRNAGCRATATARRQKPQHHQPGFSSKL